MCRTRHVRWKGQCATEIQLLNTPHDRRCCRYASDDATLMQFDWHALVPGKNWRVHARPWIPGDEIAIFTAVIHKWRSPLRQFACARTIDEYDVTILVPYIRMTSQINSGDVTILNQKRLSLATTAKSAIDNCFGGIECSGHEIACKK